MLRKLWGRKKTPSAPAASASLTDADYQKLFRQLMEGVAEGWSESQINALLDGLIAGLLSPGAIRKTETLKQRKFVAKPP